MTGIAMTGIRALLAVLVAAVLAFPALAVQPDEMLDDPALEARAREVTKEIRCLVCQNESIDDSNAELARDLRVLVRERIVAGDSNADVKQYLVDRYGEFVLLKPRFTGMNLVLWLAGPVLLILGLVTAGIYMRRRRPEAAAAEAPLSAEERAALDRALRDG